MGTLQQTKSEATRLRILDSALVLFAKNGYDATGVAEICEKAALSKGAFYHHFPSKQAVFIELLEQWLSALEAELMTAGSEATSVPDALRGMASRMRDVLQIADGRLFIFLEFWAQARRDPDVWKRTLTPFRHYREIFEALIKRGTREGSLRKVDAAAASHALVSMAVGILLQGVLDPEGEKWADVTVDAVELFIQGLLRR